MKTLRSQETSKKPQKSRLQHVTKNGHPAAIKTPGFNATQSGKGLPGKDKHVINPKKLTLAQKQFEGALLPEGW